MICLPVVLIKEYLSSASDPGKLKYKLTLSVFQSLFRFWILCSFFLVCLNICAFSNLPDLHQSY